MGGADTDAAASAAVTRPTVTMVVVTRRAPMLLFIFSITTHMRIGMQVIIEDYVQDEGTKLVLLIANTFFTIAIGLASAFAILMLSFKVV